ncbi:MAG: efflux RND transporter permease subunit, partial [Balneolaceae bacterium]
MLLEEFPEVTEVVSRTGTGEIPTDPMSLEMSDMFIILKDKDEWVSADTKEELIEKIRAKLTTLPGVQLAFTQPIEMRFNELMTGIREDIAVKIYGDDLDVLADLGAQARELISELPGAADINLEQITGLPQLKVQYDRQKMARYGVDVATVNNLIQSAYAGGNAGVIYEGERRFDLVVRLAEPYVNDLESIRNLYAVSYDGDQIPLEELAEIRYEDGPAQISRDNTRRRIVIGVNAGNQDVQTLVEGIQQKLEAGLDLPPGYNITYGGQFENLERAQARLLFAVPMALGLIFILLYFSLKSVKQALLVFSAIPLATIGGVFALWIRGLPFSISAGVGFIVLFGIAVLNGIILISFFTELKQAGVRNVNRQILMGTRQRLRPVLLTAATDMFGFMPMAVSTAAGAEVQRPLATVVIGGLITATLLTLVVLPVLYSLIEEGRLRFRPSKTIATLFLCLAVGSPAFAQPADSTLTLSQEEAVEMTLDRYPELDAAELEAKRQSVLAKTAFELPPTQISYSEEEAGGASRGVQSFGIQQSLDFPLKYIRERQAGKALTELAENRLKLTRSELKQEVSKTWQEWRYRMEVAALYRELTETFEDFEQAANLRYELGEIDQLERLSARTAYEQAIVNYEAAKDDAAIAERRLQNLLVTDQDLTPPDSEYEPLQRAFSGQSVSAEHALLQSQQSVIDVRRKETAVERSELWPDLFA